MKMPTSEIMLRSGIASPLHAHVDPSSPPAQNEERHGYLRNDNNDFLNYTDDWYILGWKPDAYAVIYYKGNNDAWKGYGGATVYTR